MKITAVKMDNYSQNNKSNIEFKATLPKVGAIPILHDGWDRVYLTCQKQNNLSKLQKVLTKLKEAGNGVLGCVWKKHDDYPTFYSAKNSVELTEKVKPILDAYKSKDSVSSVSITQKSKNIIAETYDVRMHSIVDNEILFSNGANQRQYSSTVPLKIILTVCSLSSLVRILR